MNFNVEKIEKIVSARNEELINNGKKIIEIKLQSSDGNEYSSNYVVEDWFIEKVKGKSSIYYRLRKNIVNAVGKKIEFVFSLDGEQVEYINYHHNDLLAKMGSNNLLKIYIKTRFTYGVSTTNIPYVRCQLIIADRVRLSMFASNLKTEILFDSCSSASTALDVIMERNTTFEEKDIEEVAML